MQLLKEIISVEKFLLLTKTMDISIPAWDYTREASIEFLKNNEFNIKKNAWQDIIFLKKKEYIEELFTLCYDYGIPLKQEILKEILIDYDYMEVFIYDEYFERCNDIEKRVTVIEINNRKFSIEWETHNKEIVYIKQPYEVREKKGKNENEKREI